MDEALKRANSILSAIVCGTVLLSSCIKQPEELPVPETALELVKEMGNGWNLGNTMECVAKDCRFATDFEQAWGNIKTTQACMDGIRDSNIKSVRIPVAWSNLMSTEGGKYTISQDYFDRVDQIVNYALNDGLYVIINIHWDGGWWSDFGAADSTIKRDRAFRKFQSMWTQIAVHYRDYSKRLIFECANEDLGDKLGEGNRKFDSDKCYETCNFLNQAFVDIVRNAGGKNDSRFLLISGYNADIDKTCDDRFVVPTDVIDNHLLISVHYYTPAQYCLISNVGNSWGYRDSWGTPLDKAVMKADFEKMQKFSEQGYGVVVGEYGVARTVEGKSQTLKDGTFDYVQSIVDTSKEYNYCPMFWDSGFWYDRRACKFRYDELTNIFTNADADETTTETTTE